MSVVDAISPSFLVEPDTHLVTYHIRVDDVDISAAYLILSINIQSGVNKIPSASLVIRDGSASDANFKLSDDSVFLPGKKIEILLGYNGNNETVFKGIIIVNSHKVNDVCSEMNIECKDEREKMTVTRNGQNFQNRSDVDVVQELLQSNGFDDAEIPSKEQQDAANKKHEQLVQSNVSDWDYMISRIDVNEQICVIHNGIMEAKKPDLAEAAVLSLTHGVNILEFHADMDSRVQNADVDVLTWDFAKQEVRKSKAEDPLDANTEESNDDKSADKPVKEVIDTMNSVLGKPYQMRSFFMSEQEQQAIANAKNLKKKLSPFNGKVKYKGTAKALPGNFIKLNGVGDRFNLKSFVSGISHEYADGDWTTEAILGWDDKFFAETINPQQSAAGTGQLSTVHGLHVGTVQSIEDSTGQYRVKVRLPLVNASDDGIYARVATLDAGDNRGSFFRPESGDEVIVGFVNDDPRHPVILGMLHSSAKKAPSNRKKQIPKKVLFRDQAYASFLMMTKNLLS